MKTLLDLWDASDERGRRLLAPLVQHWKAEADKEWDKAAALWVLHHVGSDMESELARARAHAFCAVLGDQSALSRAGAFDA